MSCAGLVNRPFALLLLIITPFPFSTKNRERKSAVVLGDILYFLTFSAPRFWTGQRAERNAQSAEGREHRAWGRAHGAEGRAESVRRRRLRCARC